MHLIFGNAFGYWALTGLLAVLAIHMFQLQAKRVKISTMFLVDSSSPPTTEGRALDRVRNSIPLWLQLIAVLLLTWLLLEPRWQSVNSVQKVGVILDSSLSMSAFREQLARSLPLALEKLQTSAATVEWLLVESNQSKGILYQGQSLTEMLTVFNQWQPTMGMHEFEPAIRAARIALGEDSLLTFVSDHEQKLPPGVHLLAVGKPTENVGFTGIHVSDTNGQQEWQTVVKNYGQTLQNRTWHLTVSGQNTAPRELSLDPGQTEILRGVFPQGAKEIQVVLSDDLFTIDNHLPLVLPKKKTLRVRIAVDAPEPEFFRRFFSAHDQLLAVEALHTSDLVVRSITGAEQLPQESGIYFTFVDPSQAQGNSSKKNQRSAGAAVGSSHQLTTDLSWHGLSVNSDFPVKAETNDLVLVWLKAKPVVILRASGKNQQLIFNFPLANSNAKKLPAFIVLLHRFTEEVRNHKRTLRRANLELNQQLHLGSFLNSDEVLSVTKELSNGTEHQTSIAAQDSSFLRAPATPRFLYLSQSGDELEHDAVYFADAREANLSAATSKDSVSEAAALLALENSEEDAFAPLWLAILCLALMLSWHYSSANLSAPTNRGQR